MAKRIFLNATCVGMLVTVPAISVARTVPAPPTPQSQTAEISAITVKGTVEAVDHTARTVSIRMDQGNLVTLDVGPTALRFEQIKVSDIVWATYYDTITLRLKAAGEASVDRTLEPTTVSTPGSLPGATRTRQRITTVTITGWDPVNKVVSFTGPNGTAYTRRLLDSTDPTIVSGLKSGDRVDVTRTEAVTVSVQPATQDSLRNRLTVSVLFGWDNQYGGHMIQSATGQTTTGVRINLDETSFDEVYGRIGIFKVGVGYRITPRTEGVFNFVWSSSEANEDAIQIGTAGANAQVPLTVHFTEYQYWGLEVGQRFFFARTRFTPFVGYLVGINRHQDIRGTFVNVPAAFTPGLAAQDGKFFEKSWAFSLGPTAGFLIGVGPFEVMAETQFRFIGGLSDVDWLVEEGLRDINTESERWSLPLLFGARIRF